MRVPLWRGVLVIMLVRMAIIVSCGVILRNPLPPKPNDCGGSSPNYSVRRRAMRQRMLAHPELPLPNNTAELNARQRVRKREAPGCVGKICDSDTYRCAVHPSYCFPLCRLHCVLHIPAASAPPPAAATGHQRRTRWSCRTIRAVL